MSSAGTSPNAAQPRTGQRQYSTFRVGTLLLGLDVAGVQEVIRYQRMTPVPLCPPAVRGLLNLRGQIVTAVDLRIRLGREQGAADRPINVVVLTRHGPVSLLVDQICDVLELGDDTYEPPPHSDEPALAELVTGVHKLEGRVLHIIDAERATQVGSRAAADAATGP